MSGHHTPRTSPPPPDLTARRPPPLTVPSERTQTSRPHDHRPVVAARNPGRRRSSLRDLGTPVANIFEKTLGRKNSMEGAYTPVGQSYLEPSGPTRRMINRKGSVLGGIFSDDDRDMRKKYPRRPQRPQQEHSGEVSPVKSLPRPVWGRRRRGSVELDKSTPIKDKSPFGSGLDVHKANLKRSWKKRILDRRNSLWREAPNGLKPPSQSQVDSPGGSDVATPKFPSRKGLFGRRRSSLGSPRLAPGAGLFTRVQKKRELGVGAGDGQGGLPHHESKRSVDLVAPPSRAMSRHAQHLESKASLEVKRTMSNASLGSRSVRGVLDRPRSPGSLEKSMRLRNKAREQDWVVSGDIEARDVSDEEGDSDIDQELEEEIERDRFEGKCTRWLRLWRTANNSRVGKIQEDGSVVTFSLCSPYVFRILATAGTGASQYFAVILCCILLTSIYSVLDVPSMYYNYTHDHFEHSGLYFIFARFSLGHSSGDGSVHWVVLMCAYLKVLVFPLWILFLRLVLAFTAYDVDKRSISTADYTVVLSGLDDDESADIPELLKWLEQFGEVHSILPIFRTRPVEKIFEKLLDVNRRLEKINLLMKIEQREYELDIENLRRASGEGDVSVKKEQKMMSRADSHIKRLRSQYTKVHRKITKEKTKIEMKLERVGSKILESQTRLSTGDVFVTFKYEAGARAILKNHHQLRESPRAVVRRNVLFGLNVALNYKGKMNKMTKEDRVRFRGRFLKCRRTDEPDEVYYANYELGTCERVWRTVLMWIIVFSCVFTCFAITLGLSEYKHEVQDTDVLPGTSIQIVRFVNVCQSLFTLFSSSLIRKVFVAFRWVEGHRSESGSERWLIIYVTVSQVVNSMIIPLIVEYNPAHWYDDGGLAEQALIMSLWTSVFVAPSHYMQTFFRIKRYGCSWCFLKKESVALKLMQNPEWVWSERYAIGLKGFYLAMAFGGINPLCYIFATYGLVTTFFMDYYLFLRVYKRPTIISDKVGPGIRWLMKFSFFTLCINSSYFYLMQARQDLVDNTWDAYIYTIFYCLLSLGVSMLILLFPTSLVFPNLTVKKTEVEEGDKPFDEVNLKPYVFSPAKEAASDFMIKLHPGGNAQLNFLRPGLRRFASTMTSMASLSTSRDRKNTDGSQYLGDNFDIETNGEPSGYHSS